MVRWAVLADAVAVFHFAYVAFVGGGCVAILLGVVRGWAWVRGLTFRIVHLVAIGFVFIESLAGIDCPLTVLEGNLREKAGQVHYPGAFIGYWAHRLTFYDVPPWAFTILYGTVTLAIVAGLWWAPPRIDRTGQ
ncbi:MAG TPA: DUF2784 domain-containing protein [Candidatus Binataceae bacterium]|nr:DUF2784 domain-containing protein [Candidatus Binataceae bacterium]